MTGAWPGRINDNFDALLPRMIALSVALHVAIFIGAVHLSGRTPEPLGFRYIEATVMTGPPGPAPRGRPDAVPAAMKKKEKEPDRKDIRKKEPEKNDSMVLPKEKSKKSRAKEKEPEEPRSIDSAIERIRKSHRDKLGLPDGDAKVSAVYPGGGGMANRIVSLYLHKVSSTIRRNWSLPSGIARDPNLHVKILVRIGRNGDLLERRIHQSSGITLIDQSAMNAVVKSTPFPAPPPLVAPEIEREGILFDFFPEE